MPKDMNLRDNRKTVNCDLALAHETSIDTTSIEKLLKEEIGKQELLDALTDLLIDYSMNRTDGSDVTFKENINTIALLINSFRGIILSDNQK